MLQRSTKQRSLLSWWHVRDNNNHAGMKWFVGVKSQKIHAIVGHERVFLLTNVAMSCQSLYPPMIIRASSA